MKSWLPHGDGSSRVHVTRRGFLSAVTVLAGGVFDRATDGDASVVPTIACPASIERLTPMTDLVTPISADERRLRIDRARRLMAGQAVDGLVISQAASVEYFSGIRPLSGRRLALVIPRGQAPYVVSGVGSGLVGAVEALAAPAEGEMASVLARSLKDRGLACGCLAVDETIDPDLLAGMAAVNPAQQFVHAGRVVDGCRRIKDSHEIELLRLAADATLRCYAVISRALRPGVTQQEIGAWTMSAYARVGFPGTASVRVGPSTSRPHGSLAAELVREGDVMVIEGGCSVAGYRSNLARTFVVGEASPEISGLFEHLAHARRSALASVKSGASITRLFAAARRALDAGSRGARSHYVAHGIGMDSYEAPSRTEPSTSGALVESTLEPGMVLIGEPALYMRGRFGVQATDVFHVTEAGAELLTES